jgi:acyl transferase domain-containing protein
VAEECETSRKETKEGHRALLHDALRALEKMQARLEANEKEKTEPIAIIGLGCRFPGGANSPEKFWSLLRAGFDAVGQIPPDRWNADAYYDPDPDMPGKMYTRHGAFLDELGAFDSGFFGISPREASVLDPQQRLILEVSWEAIEHAGLAASGLAGSRTGVFVGIGSHDYSELQAKTNDPTRIDPYTGSGGALCFAAGRLSYFFGFQGPSMIVDTACSSSLLAVHLACLSLRNAECRTALAGGVHLMLSPAAHIYLSRLKALSANGRCKVFDAGADGFARGEGCGMVVLKRYRDAVEDNDNVIAIIRGSAVNQDGASGGLTVPNGSAQKALISTALAKAGVDPARVGYVEAHGTGTSLGDPIEMRALVEVLGKGRSKDQPLVVGSVKTNIGHLEAAAGIAGLFKAALSLQHGKIPPHLHFRNLNPHIDFQGSPVIIPTEIMEWPAGDGPRTTGISSFGLSGTNVFTLLEQAPPRSRERSEPARPFEILTLSAKTEHSLRELAQSYGGYLERNHPAPMADVCRTANAGRSHFANRLALVVESSNEGVEAARRELSAWALSGKGNDTVLAGTVPSGDRLRIAFVFAAEALEYANMGRGLYDTEPTFRKTMDMCGELLDCGPGPSFVELIYPERGLHFSMTQEAYSQAALFALEYSLAQLWLSWGIEPAAVAGYGVGEYAAACVAGVFGPADALKIAAARGRLMNEMNRKGPPDLDLSLTDRLVDEFYEACGQVVFHLARIPFFCSQTGRFAGNDEILGPEYWCGNLFRTTRHYHSPRRLLRQGCNFLLDIGPDYCVTSSENGMHSKAPCPFLPSLSRYRDDRQQVLMTLGTLYVHGADIDWEAFCKDPAGHRISLPTYPFQREHYSIVPENIASNRPEPRSREKGSHPILGTGFWPASQPGTYVRQGEINLDDLPYLRDHMVQGAVVLPNAAYLEMVLASAAEAFGEGPVVFFEMENKQVLVPAKSETPQVQVVLSPAEEGRYSFAVYSGQRTGGGKEKPTGNWTLHVSGKLLYRPAGETVGTEAPFNIQDVLARCTEEVSGSDFYRMQAERGNQWGPCFQGIERLWLGDGEALSLVRVPKALESDTALYRFHPAVSDASGHVLSATIPIQKTNGSRGGAFVAKGVDEITIYRKPQGTQLWGYARIQPASHMDQDLLVGNIQVTDETGALVASTTGARFWYLDRNEQEAPTQNPDHWFYELQWKPAEWSDTLSHSSGGEGIWLILSDNKGTGEALNAVILEHGEKSILVFAGESYRALDGQRFLINPNQPEDLPRLFEDTLGPGAPFLRGIVYLWGLDAPCSEEKNVSTLDESLIPGCAGVMRLVQELTKERRPASPRIWLVTRGAQAVKRNEEHPAIFQAPLWGIGRTIATEHPELWGGLLDLDPARTEPDTAGFIWQEICGPDKEDQVAVRAGRRYVARLVHKKVSSPQTAGFRCRSDCTYLITGGLGGIGFQVSRRLAEKGARNLILMGRTKIPPRSEWEDIQETGLSGKISAIRELEAMGVKVYVPSVDVADEVQLRTFIEAYDPEGRHPIRGVVHAAGIVQYEPLVDHDVARMTAVLEPKIIGGWLLHRIFKDTPLDFFVLFSSLSSVLSSPFLGSYAAANAFLDALAHYRKSQGRPGLSINWATWTQTGMATVFEADSSRMLKGIKGISNEQGLEAMERLIRQDSAQVVVMPVDWSEWRKLYPAYTASPFFQSIVANKDDDLEKQTISLTGRKILYATEPEERRSLVETYLVEQVAKVLKLPTPSLDPRQPISAMGFDSLMAVELRNRIEKDLGQVVPMVKFLQGPSVFELTEMFFGELATASAASSLNGPEKTPAGLAGAFEDEAWEEGIL